MKTKALTFLAVAGSLILAAFSLSAQTLYWDSNGTTAGAGATPTGTWGTSTFWSTASDGTAATAGWTSGGNAVFSAGSDATGPFAVTLSGNQTAGSVLVEEGNVTFAGSGAVVLGAGTVTVNSGATLVTGSSARISATAGSKFILNGGTLVSTNLSTAGSFVDVDAVIELNGGGTLSYTTAGLLNIVQTTTIISGTGPLTKEGAGILAIASPSIYSGDTIINAGTLRVRGANNRLPIGTDVKIASGANFDPASLSSISQEVRSVSGAGNVTFSASGTMVVNLPNTIPSQTLSGIIQDGSAFGKVEKKGTGEWILAGLNTFDGTFTQSAGTTTVNSGAALAGAGADLVVNGGTLNLNNAAQTVLSLSGSGGTVNLGSGHELTVNNGAGAAKTFAGRIRSNGALKKTGAGAFILTGDNDYSGGTTVSGGALVVNGSIGSGAVTVDSGAALHGNGTIGGATTINGLIAPGSNSVATLTFSSDLTLANNTAMDIDPSLAQNADLLSAGNIVAGGTLTVVKAGGTLADGQQFNLFDGNISGGFGNIVLPDVSAQLWSWDTSGLLAGGDGVLRLVPEPSAVTLALLGGFGLLVLRRRR